MTEVLAGWTLDVERGPHWLFVRLQAPPDELGSEGELAARIWELLECHFTYRVVLEMYDLPMLNSRLVGQLVLLHKRVSTHGGVVRLCGLSDACQQVLRVSRLDDRFPQYRTREEAVNAYAVPRYPR